MPYFEDDNRSPRNRRDSRGGAPRERRGQRPGQGRPNGNHERLRQGGNSNQRRQRDLPYKSRRNYRTIMGTDTGLSLGGGRRRRPTLIRGIDDRYVIGAAIVLLLVLTLVIGGCVRSCTSKKEAEPQPTEVNSADSRVAAGVSDSLTSQFTVALDRSEDLAWIAQNANRYSDERIPELALIEPDAIPFVKAVPDAEKTAKPYEEGNEKGTYPLVYDWDTRWGFVDYAGSNIGVNGSGLTSLFIAYAGLTGNVDKTPADLAAAATEGSFTDEVLGTNADFFTSEAPKLGLTINEYEPNISNLNTVLYSGGVVIVQLQSNYTTPYAHWAIAVYQSADGSVTLYDPTSSTASTHFWTPESIMSHSDKFFALTYTAPADGGDAAATGQGTTDAPANASGTDAATATGTDAANGATGNGTTAKASAVSNDGQATQRTA